MHGWREWRGVHSLQRSSPRGVRTGPQPPARLVIVVGAPDTPVRGPGFRSCPALLTWVHWVNTTRLLEPLGYGPPAEFEAQHYETIPPHVMQAVA